ncbi:MAG: formylglycine-generating enzyme family protein [Arenicella sp.]|nr:formylglycine-generating enzyme family protein [Arenicella sp.]
MLLLSACQNTDDAEIACSQAGAEATFIAIPSGDFTKANLPVYPEEGTPELVSVEAFQMQSTEVTNAQFSTFVEATAYVTDAERPRAIKQEEGSAVFPVSEEPTENARWQLVKGATWRHPDGPDSSIEGKAKHPVVHVSLRDARAYAQWADGRLPTELEWEYAASLSVPSLSRADSGAYNDRGQPVANTWQGVFPMVNSAADGFHGSAPVACFPAGKNGLYDMIGNVWEWTDTPVSKSAHLIKGGSFLCANNFCKRYRAAARQQQDIDFSTNHLGFRIVKDLHQ